jgi:hypothetical protein
MSTEIFGFDIERCIEYPLTQQQRGYLYRGLQQWFQATPKVACPDLDQKVAAFNKALYNLAMTVNFKPAGNEFKTSVKACATGDALITLNQVRNGTLWFTGWVSAQFTGFNFDSSITSFADIRMFCLTQET